jgi:hypothetical protein
VWPEFFQPQFLPLTALHERRQQHPLMEALGNAGMQLGGDFSASPLSFHHKGQGNEAALCAFCPD